MYDELLSQFINFLIGIIPVCVIFSFISVCIRVLYSFWLSSDTSVDESESDELEHDNFDGYEFEYSDIWTEEINNYNG